MEPHRSFLQPVVYPSVGWFSISSISSTGFCSEAFARDPKGNNNSSNSSAKVGMMLTAYFMVLPFIWTGTAAELIVPPCDEHMFDSNSANCLSEFNRSMETRGNLDRCPWPDVKGIYNQLKTCVDNWANESWCSGHGFLVDNIFLEVHQTYFHQCGQIQDPPLFTLIMLIAPVIIVTLFMPILCVQLNTYNMEIPSTAGL